MATDPRPPRLVLWILTRLLSASPNREALLGDLDELYSARAAAGPKLAADLWFLREAILAAIKVPALSGRAPVPPRAETRLRRRFMRQLVLAGLELRMAVRRLRRNPGFATAAVLTLALGIGATAAVLTGIYDILLKPLPYPDAGRLVVIQHELPGFEMPGGRTATIGALYAQLAHYRERSRSFEEIGGFASFDAVIGAEGDPQYLRMAAATAGFFRALGLGPRLGRLLEDDDPAPDQGAISASVLADGFWAQRFGRDPGVLGRVLNAQGFANEIVGVLPPSLEFPPDPVSVWTSIPPSRLHDKPEWTLTLLLGRLAPGVTPQQARDELNRLIPELPDSFPQPMVRRAVVEGRLRAKVTPVRAWLVGGLERPLWLLLAAVGLVLAIACVNVTNLILVRTDARRHEIAVRTALGASTADLTRSLAADSVVLVTIAAALGIGLAHFGLHALLRFAPTSVGALAPRDAGWDVAGFSAIPAVACMGILGVVAWLAYGRRRSGDFRNGSPTAGRAQLRVRHILVAVQFAMTLVVLVGAGLILRSFLALSDVELGFEPRGVLTFRVVFPFQEVQRGGPGRYGPATNFYDRLAERLRRLPGVAAVGYGTCVPLSDTCDQAGFSLRRADRPGALENVPATLALLISPGYLDALQVSLLQGRHLEARDHLERTNAVILSAEAARRFFHGDDPLGQHLVQDGTQWMPFTVVGVVGNVQHEDPRNAHVPFAYMPVLGDFAPSERWAVSYVVRASGSLLALVEPIRAEVAALRSDIPVAHVETLSGIVARSTVQLRFALWLLALAAGSALALSAIGGYGLMAYVVSLRRKEFGIRLALGADGRQLRSMVVRQGAVTAAAGLLMGVGAATVLRPLFRSLLFEIGPDDPVTFAGVLCVLSVTALFAIYIPARRASRVDAAEVLRTE